MNRETFMKDLEYLLQDIPDEEKADALSYYADYLEEAGPENEEKVLKEFGSPERIAAIIRADLKGDLESGGGFTEQGYEDDRFRQPNFQLAHREEEKESFSLPPKSDGADESSPAALNESVMPASKETRARVLRGASIDADEYAPRLRAMLHRRSCAEPLLCKASCVPSR